MARHLSFSWNQKERKAAEEWVGVTVFKSVVHLNDREKKKKETIRFLSYVRHLPNSGLSKESKILSG